MNIMESYEKTADRCELYGKFIDNSKDKDILKGVCKQLSEQNQICIAVCGGQSVNISGIAEEIVSLGLFEEYKSLPCPVEITYGAETKIKLTDADGNVQGLDPESASESDIQKAVWISVEKNDARLAGKRIVLIYLSDTNVQQMFAGEISAAHRTVLLVDATTGLRTYDHQICEMTLARHGNIKRISFIVDNRAQVAVSGHISSILKGKLRTDEDITCREYADVSETVSQLLFEMCEKSLSFIDVEADSAKILQSINENLTKAGEVRADELKKLLKIYVRKNNDYLAGSKIFHSSFEINKFRTRFIITDDMRAKLFSDIIEFVIVLQKNLPGEFQKVKTNDEILVYFPHYFNKLFREFLDDELKRVLVPLISDGFSELCQNIYLMYRNAFKEDVPDDINILLSISKKDFLNMYNSSDVYIANISNIPFDVILSFALLASGLDWLSVVIQWLGIDRLINNLGNMIVEKVMVKAMPRKSFNEFIGKKVIERLDEIVNTLQKAFDVSVFPMVNSHLTEVLDLFLNEIDICIDRQIEEHKKCIDDTDTDLKILTYMNSEIV